MTKEEIYGRLEGVFCDVFGRSVAVSAGTSAAVVEGWDSFAHISLIRSVEAEFGVRFPMEAVLEMSTAGAIADKVDELLSRQARTAMAGGV